MALPAVSGVGPAPNTSLGVDVVVRDLSHAYPGPDGPVPVLSAVRLDLGAGSYVALGGRSGAGKTTLLSILGGLEAPQAGEVIVGGVDLASLGGDALAAYRRSTVGFVFQDFGLLDPLTALENVELALALARIPARIRRQRASELLDAVGLAHRASHRPASLSGGERQRVAIGRALANRPRLILADEPTGNLDPESAGTVLDLLEGLPRDHGCTLVVVTHNPAVSHRAPIRMTLTGGRLDGAPDGAAAQ